MKHHPIALVVDFQFTIKPFSLSWRSYRIFFPFVVHFSPRSTEPTRRSSEKSGTAIEIMNQGALSGAPLYPSGRACPLPHFKAAGWSWDCVSAIDSDGRTIWIVEHIRDDGKLFVVRAPTERQRDARAAIPSIGLRSYRQLSGFSPNSALCGTGVKAESLSPEAFFPAFQTCY